MKSRISKFLSIILPLLLGFFLIVYQYYKFTPEQILEMKWHFRNADYFYIFLSLFIALFGFLSRAYRWKYALNYLGFDPKFHNNLMAVCISYFINLTIPRSGEITRAVIMKKYEDVPFDKGFGTIVGERIVDFAIFLLFVFLSLAFQFNVLKKFILEQIPVERLLVILAFAFVFLILFVVVWIYSRWKFIDMLKQKISGLAEGIMSVVRMPDRLPYLYHSFFIWSTYLLMFYVMIFALPETSSIGFGAVITAFVFGSLAIGFTNSGFGAYPFLVSQILLLYGVDGPAGAAFGWLAWISQTLLIIVLGLASFIMLPILNRNK